jgi:RimJ/RimL family protein N-acetyltransferase
MELHVGRLLVRPVRPLDRAALVGLLTDPVLMSHALQDRAFTADEADDFLRTGFARDQSAYGMHVVELASAVIGFTGYRRCKLLGHDDAEFGWVLMAAHHRCGYATALGHKLISNALTTLNLPRVHAACHPENTPSERVLRDKLQMRFEREVAVSSTSRRRVYCAP